MRRGMSCGSRPWSTQSIFMPAPSLGNIPIITQAEEHFADLAQTEKDDALQADDERKRSLGRLDLGRLIGDQLRQLQRLVRRVLVEKARERSVVVAGGPARPPAAS